MRKFDGSALKVFCVDFPPEGQECQDHDGQRAATKVEEADKCVRDAGCRVPERPLDRHDVCPSCAGAPFWLDGPVVEYQAVGMKLEIKLVATLECRDGHKWESSLPKIIELKVDQALGTVVQGGVSRSSAGDIDLHIVCSQGEGCLPQEEINVFGLDGMIERLLFCKLGGGGSYFRSYFSSAVLPTFHAVNAIVVDASGLQFEIVAPYLWTRTFPRL